MQGIEQSVSGLIKLFPLRGSHDSWRTVRVKYDNRRILYSERLRNISTDYSTKHYIQKSHYYLSVFLAFIYIILSFVFPSLFRSRSSFLSFCFFFSYFSNEHFINLSVLSDLFEDQRKCLTQLLFPYSLSLSSSSLSLSLSLSLSPQGERGDPGSPGAKGYPGRQVQ